MTRLRTSLLLLVATTAACAHYGWSASESRVDVQTVTIDAADGIEPATLTRRLVDELRLRGIDARWAGEEDGKPLDCRLTIDENPAGSTLQPVASVRCSLDEIAIDGRGSAQASLAGSIARGTRRIHQHAAEAAIDDVAASIARHLTTPTQSSP